MPDPLIYQEYWQLPYGTGTIFGLLRYREYFFLPLGTESILDFFRLPGVLSTP